jgi:hypothetical protein
MTRFNVEGDIVIGEFCTADTIADSSIEIGYIKNIFFCQVNPTLLYKFCGHFLFTGNFESKTLSLSNFPRASDFMAPYTRPSRG